MKIFENGEYVSLTIDQMKERIDKFDDKYLHRYPPYDEMKNDTDTLIHLGNILVQECQRLTNIIENVKMPF